VFIMALVTVELTEEELKKIREIADELRISAEDVLRYALDLDPKELKLRIVLELLKRRKITVWRAARILKISFREMEEIMRRHGVEYPISEESVIREAKEIKSSE